MDRVSIRAAFERFPVGVKGAFVVRGADGLPHQVRMEAVRLAECSGRGSHAVPVESSIIEAAPTMDTFLPFDAPTMDLPPGWYRLECDVVVDGDPFVVQPGPRFAIAWPRGTVRRGTVVVGKTAGEVVLGAVECTGDQIRLTYEAPTEPRVTLALDGAPHPILEVEHDQAAGKGRVVAYPVPRTASRLTVEIRGGDPVVVTLP